MILEHIRVQSLVVIISQKELHYFQADDKHHAQKMHLWCWLLAASSILNEVACLPIPKLQQRSLGEAVATTSKQQSNLLRRFFPERLAPRILAQAYSTRNDDTINHVQDTLEYLVTYPKLDRRSAPVNSGKHVLQHREKSLNRFGSLLFEHVTLIELKANIASEELATRSLRWSRTLEIAARLKRQTTCGNSSQCGNGNDNNGNGNGIGNTANSNSGGGLSTSDKIALGVGIPAAVAALLAIIDSLTTKILIGCIIGIRRKTKRRKGGKEESPNGVNSNTSLPQQKSGAQPQVLQPHGVPELPGQWQTRIELATSQRQF
jgi:hypothetical protein